LYAPPNSLDSTIRDWLEVLEALDIAGHGGRAESVNTNLEGIGVKLGFGWTGVEDTLISNNSKFVEVVLGGHSLGELGEPLGGEQTIHTTHSPADKAGHATTNLQEAENEGKGKFDCFVLPCQVIQWRWLSKLLLLLSFHALFEPMVSN
jgi:hypothetical protein